MHGTVPPLSNTFSYSGAWGHPFACILWSVGWLPLYKISQFFDFGWTGSVVPRLLSKLHAFYLILGHLNLVWLNWFMRTYFVFLFWPTFFLWGGTYVTRYCGHFWPIVQPQMIDGGDCGVIGGMKIGRGNRSTLRKPAPAPLCPPRIPLDQTRARTRAAAVGSQRLTAWAMARPSDLLYFQFSLALASLTSGGRSVDIVRLGTTSHGV
jgi:hypothetical protein